MSEAVLRRHLRDVRIAPLGLLTYAGICTVSEAQGEVWETRVLYGQAAVGGLRPGAPESTKAQVRVSEGMISNER